MGDKLKNKFESFAAIITLLLVVLAIILGNENSTSDLETILKKSQSDLELRIIEPGLYSSSSNLGDYYVCIENAEGYGGYLKLAVTIDSLQMITTIHILDHKETNSYFRKVEKNEFIKLFISKSIHDVIFSSSADVISGATCTSNAISNAIYAAVKNIGERVFEMEIPAKEKSKLVISFLEVFIIVLLLSVLIIQNFGSKYMKYIRWVSIILSVIFIGFIYNSPITLSKFSSFISGYFPHIQGNLYWYILFFGVFLILILTNKNPYCYWICPFGGAQDCLAEFGKAKIRNPNKNIRYLLVWLQRFVALGFLLTALYYQNSSLAVYEVFGALFKFTGTDIMFILLAITLITSLFIKRPWCNYLCPINALFDYVKFMRKMVVTLTNVQKELCK